jgi:hypothetical protein
MIVEPNVKQYWHQETSSGTLIQKPSFFELHDATVYQLSDKEISELHFDNYMSEDFLETAEPDWAAFTTVESREKQEEKESIHREPLSSLYDLFGFSEQERRQENKPKNNKKKVQRKHPAQPNLFAQPANTGIQETQTEIQQDILNINTGQENTFSVEPRPYSSSLQDFYKSGSLVMDNGQIGFLKERYQGDAVFMPLALNPQQAQKANLYIQFRDTYHLLYNYEATEKRCKGWKIIFSYFSARCKPYIYRAYTLH